MITDEDLRAYDLGNAVEKILTSADFELAERKQNIAADIERMEVKTGYKAAVYNNALDSAQQAVDADTRQKLADLAASNGGMETAVRLLKSRADSLNQTAADYFISRDGESRAAAPAVKRQAERLNKAIGKIATQTDAEAEEKFLQDARNRFASLRYTSQ